MWRRSIDSSVKSPRASSNSIRFSVEKLAYVSLCSSTSFHTDSSYADVCASPRHVSTAKLESERVMKRRVLVERDEPALCRIVPLRKPPEEIGFRARVVGRVDHRDAEPSSGEQHASRRSSSPFLECACSLREPSAHHDR